MLQLSGSTSDPMGGQGDESPVQTSSMCKSKAMMGKGTNSEPCALRTPHGLSLGIFSPRTLSAGGSELSLTSSPELKDDKLGGGRAEDPALASQASVR